MLRIFFDNDVFIHSIREYLEYDNEYELLSLLTIVKVEARNDFNDYGLDINPYRHDLLLKVPVTKIKELSIQTEKLRPYINEICQTFGGIYINQIMVGLLTSKEQQEVEKVSLLDHHLNFYHNLIKVVSNATIDDIEKTYIIESCNCLLNGNNLAAATMLGCAIERVVILLANSCLLYLENGNGSEQELKNFTDKVINRKNANDRLSGLINFVKPKKDLFAENGFENVEIHLSHFDFIRQLRNEAGHPTGTIISEEDLFNHLIYYNDIFKKTHKIIEFLQRT
ncbi:hypothetical protein [Paenibacillus wynnii]|uniref:Uncharacterized protein n=1 Tax=Paenibacillus wynnii TaxID=268407 RepID=A0A098M2K4_9BACL|nr:hypothetical protein [Paenibacillus wynnii]KGE16619.1 hypothetical protein PWYN_18065 [Paenibacillus wynnii]